MIDLFTQCDPDYGQRVVKGLEMVGSVEKEKMAPAFSEAVKQAVTMGRELDM